MVEFESVIGLEVHAELLTKSKIFCESSAHFGGEPNTQVGPVSLGLPGTLPVLNQRVVEMAIKAGLATHCTIPRQGKFDRKHYFYPDLPKGYQITQYDQPIAQQGWLDIDTETGPKRIRINRIHMEEDAGKLVHAGTERLSGSHYSLADYNRAGVPLLEIVSEPDIRSSAEARAYLAELRSILMAIGVCDGKMQEGSLRCDANISIRPRGSTTYGTRVEIKNVNSFRFLQKAIDYEIERQSALTRAGETFIQETRLWDEHRDMTISMRSKEDAHDYRYFPDPDLVLLDIDPAWVTEIQQSLPELPAQQRERYQHTLGLAAEEARKLVAEPVYAQFFEATCEQGGAGVAVARWLLGDIAAYLNEHHCLLQDTHMTPKKLAEIVILIEKGTISGKIAKEVLRHLLETNTSAIKIVETLGLTQISDNSALLTLIHEILQNNPTERESYLQGKEKLLGFFVGQVMKQTNGRADPKLTNQLVRQQLERYRTH